MQRVIRNRYEHFGIDKEFINMHSLKYAVRFYIHRVDSYRTSRVLVEKPPQYDSCFTLFIREREYVIRHIDAVSPNIGLINLHFTTLPLLTPLLIIPFHKYSKEYTKIHA